MPTRFYLPSTGTPDITYTPPVGTGAGQWNAVGSPVHAPLPTGKISTAIADGAIRTRGSLTGVVDVLDRVFISKPISAQTITGSYSAVIKADENNLAADTWTQIDIRVVSNDGTVERGLLHGGSTATVVSGTAGAENQEWATNPQTRIKNALTLTSVTAQAGDRIVVCVGPRIAGTKATTYGGNLVYGDTGADLALSAGSTADGVPWIELSQTLTFEAVADTQAPTVPTGVTATAVAHNQINLSWNASTDNVAVASYRVRRGGVDLPGATALTGTTYSDTTVSASTSYSYTVSAVDTSGNRSAESTAASATTPAPPDLLSDWTAATTGASVVDTAGGTDAATATVAAGQVTATDAAAGTDSVSTSVNRDVAAADTATATDAAAVVVAAAHTATAADTAAGVDAAAVVVAVAHTATAADTASSADAVSVVAAAARAPSDAAAATDTAAAVLALTAPTGLTVTVISATQLDVSWSAVPGADGYDIERDGAIIVTGHPTATYSDTGLTGSTSYTYRVRTVDVVTG